MFNKKTKTDDKLNLVIDQKIEELVEQLAAQQVGTPVYDELVERIEELKSLRPDKEVKKGFKIDPTVVTALIGTAGSLLGTMLILKYEDDGNILTSSSKSVANRLLNGK